MSLSVAAVRTRTTEEWEDYLGQQIRNLRIRSNLDQVQLAGRADVSIGALKNLENGKGSSLKTLIKIIKALDRPEWLEALAPAIAISPMQMLHAQAAQKPRLKVFRNRRASKAEE